ncbi:hypothetical protein [Micromonospora craniellae]|uniref:Secreted protein n=1 Tax=Micromonospora craniellae TaxID=2294034 RepID=A0A372FTQ7_9ACTN|nr:hypothetical protein [Micromonospora craniellae]QOC92313.1 hypothetical protein ID554_00450 [Micromonospora craniellae]RFS44135.1 hypothetical protein D0Q02_24060 [Micromonospora craniellae]
MRKQSLRQRLVRTTLVVTLVASGLGTTAGAAHAAPVPAVNAAVSAAPVTQAAAGAWLLQGVFPDPITCHIAGVASGREYVCVWYVLAWALNIWQD